MIAAQPTASAGTAGARAPGLVRALCLICALCTVCRLDASEAAAEEQLRLGVLALRGKEIARRTWGPTAAYLGAQLGRGQVALIPLDFNEIERAVAAAELDLVLANPAYFVRFERRHGVSPIATLRNDSPEGPQTWFGGVIFTRADHPGLQRLADLRGRTLGAVDPRSLGGYMAALGRLREIGIDPDRDLGGLDFLATHDAVVEAVLEARVDAGTVRTDTLERMAAEGKLDLGRVRVLGPRVEAGFPYRLSTALYPDWPMAALGHVDERLRHRIAEALLAMPRSGAAARASHTRGWTAPAPYQQVHRLLAELALPPYEPPPAPALSDLVQRAWPALLGGLAFLVILGAYAAHVRLVNQRLVATQRSLGQTQRDQRLLLEELAMANEELVVERASLEEARGNFRSLVEENRSGILILDQEGIVSFANPAARALLGAGEGDLRGESFGVPAVTEGAEETRHEIDIVRPDGARGVAALAVTQTRWQGRLAFLVMLHDITERKAVERRFRRLAFRDSLTGLPNRDLFMDRLRAAIALAGREGKGVALVFLDLDRFKEINDTRGHAAGDQLLRAVAQRLRALPRASDTVARLGGDEFTAIFYGVESPAQAAAICAKLVSAFEAPFDIDGGSLGTSASVGASLFPALGSDAESLLRQADTAMYVVKRRGGNGCTLYDPSMGLGARSRLDLADDLCAAWEGRQIDIVYRPRLVPGSRRRAGLAAGLRWRHPVHGEVPPETLHGLLASTGLVEPVWAWMLDAGCAQLRDWTDQGLGPGRLAIGLSPLRLERGDLVETVRVALAAHRVPPDRLALEIGESVLEAALAQPRDLPRRLCGLGVSLHLDARCGGHASLSLLKQVPAAAIKIDPTLTAGLGRGPADRALVSALVHLAHDLGLEAIATALQRPEQEAVLAELGCDAAEGDLLAPAMAPGEVVEWLTQSHELP